MANQETHQFDAQSMHALQPFDWQLSAHFNDNIQIVCDILWSHQLRVNVIKLQARGKGVLIATVEQIHFANIGALAKQLNQKSQVHVQPIAPDAHIFDRKNGYANVKFFRHFRLRTIKVSMVYVFIQGCICIYNN